MRLAGSRHGRPRAATSPLRIDKRPAGGQLPNNRPFAPGAGITSTIIGPQGSGYASWRGNSMATPLVRGAAALGRERWPTAAAAELGQLLEAAMRNLDADNPTYAGQIGGLLDIGGALALAGPPAAAALNGEAVSQTGGPTIGPIFLPLVGTTE
jgi:subtilisin family serine protease